MKYKNHPSIIAIKEKPKNEKFSFHEVNNEKIERGIMRLNKNKASQKSDIPIRIIKDNVDIFADFLCETVNYTIKTSNFPSCLKLADITPLLKREGKTIKKTTDLSAFYQHYQKYLKEFYLTKYQVSLIIFYQKNNADLEKDIVNNIV